MIKTPVNSELGEMYMVVDLGYACQLIFSMEDGVAFLNTYVKGKECSKDYKKPIEIKEGPKKVSIEFISKREVAEAAFKRTVEGENG